MFKKFIAVLVFSLFANGALAANSYYKSTLEGQQYRISSVTISASDEVLAEDEMYDGRDVAVMQKALHKKVMSALSRNELIDEDGVRLELVITKMTPNRPTLARYSSEPGIDFRSFGLGGARLEARLIDAEGNELGTISFSWEERWIDEVVGATTWYDARRAFSRFSRRLARDLSSQKGS